MKFDKSIFEKIEYYLTESRNNFIYLGAGSFRRVFRRGNIVIKVPKNQDGLYDNMIEAYAWKKLRDKPSEHGIVCTPCRLLSNGCLMMVFIDTSDWMLGGGEENKPAWSIRIDGRQVGKYKNRWVAFDYALDLIERHAWERALKIESYFFQYDYAKRNPFVQDPNKNYDQHYYDSAPTTDNNEEEEEEDNCTCNECVREYLWQDEANAVSDVQSL
jgi:hypothetical protein